MKKKIALLLTLAVASVMAYFIGYNYGNHLGSTIPVSKNYYAMTTIISYVDEKADEVNCVDVNGNEWVFTGVEDWCAGDICSMMMYNNATPKNIYDDEIVSCRYGGTFE